jgi:hypothetical protein
MLECLIENTYVVVGGIEIAMGTNCAPSLIDLFLYSFEAEFIQKEKEISFCGLQFNI